MKKPIIMISCILSILLFCLMLIAPIVIAAGNNNVIYDRVSPQTDNLLKIQNDFLVTNYNIDTSLTYKNIIDNMHEYGIEDINKIEKCQISYILGIRNFSDKENYILFIMLNKDNVISDTADLNVKIILNISNENFYLKYNNNDIVLVLDKDTYINVLKNLI